VVPSGEIGSQAHFGSPEITGDATADLPDHRKVLMTGAACRGTRQTIAPR
jgi:hypothetical protein